MKRALQILTHKGMINGEFTCLTAGLLAGRQAGSNLLPLKNKI